MYLTGRHVGPVPIKLRIQAELAPAPSRRSSSSNDGEATTTKPVSSIALGRTLAIIPADPSSAAAADTATGDNSLVAAETARQP